METDVSFFSFYKSFPVVCVGRRINPVHYLPFYFLKIRFNIILTFTHKSSKWSLPLWLYSDTVNLVRLLVS